VSDKTRKTEQDHFAETIDRLLDAALPNVPFDGWGAGVFETALSESGVDVGLARLACPRGALDLAIGYHRQGDRAMVQRMKDADLSQMRYSARVAAGVRFRLEAISDVEIVRRGLTFFAMPANAADGAAAVWGTADLIWVALGDRSDDINWYSKRTILSAVYASTLLYWLGDQSENHHATWDFLDRRIMDVMRFEKFKSSFKGSSLGQGFLRGPGRLFEKIKAPQASVRRDLPGYISSTQE